jgi:hypothetical protein
MATDHGIAFLLRDQSFERTLPFEDAPCLLTRFVGRE